MVRLLVIDSENLAVGGAPNDNAKGEDIFPEPSISSLQRRKLVDISNLPQQAKLMSHGAKQQLQLQQQQSILLSSKEYVEKLQKENMTLMKVLADRNKIIELSSIELQKLRISLQKVQEQNLHLAQANTQMLTELNANKDRLKALQHELGCKNGLLKARKMQLEEQTIPKMHHTSEPEAGANGLGEADEAFQADDVASKNSKRKQQSRTKSLGSSNIKSALANEKPNKKRRVSGRKNFPESEGIDNANGPKETSHVKDSVDNVQFSDGENQIKENVDNKMFVSDGASQILENVNKKRQHTTRQSAKFESREAGQTENMHEMDDAKRTKENESGLSLRRQSARIKGQAPEASDDLHEIYEVKGTTKSRRASVRRQSTRFKFDKSERTETLDGIQDGQETTRDAGCSVRGQSVGCTSEALKSAKSLHETNDTKETTGEQRTSTRRQSTKHKQHRTAAAADGIKTARSAEPPSLNDMVGECNSLPEPKTEADGTEGMRRTSVGRSLRNAAGKVQSYKEVSLKVKMRRPE